MDHSKIDSADLDSPRRELFVRSLGFVVALSFFWQSIFGLRLLGEQSNCRDISVFWDKFVVKQTILQILSLIGPFDKFSPDEDIMCLVTSS